jgi:tRNA uridine 5-carbamoylmethylation protein Kti12
MKLVFLYGPPASGKFTVAEELAKATKFRLFHNHLVADLASAIFSYGTKEYSDLASELRLLALRAALRSKAKGLIVTYAYGVETWQGKGESAFVRDLVREVRRARAKIYFVKLECEPAELARRVKDASRKKFNKTRDPSVLRTILRNYPVTSPIPRVESFVIDTTSVSPRKAAALIKKKWRLVS